MKKNPPLTQEDSELFHQAVTLVKPLKPRNQITPPHSTLKPIKRAPVFYEDAACLETAPLVKGDEILSYRREGIQHRVFKKLKQGDFSVDARLDLHGLRVGEAQQAVFRFLLQSVARGFYCVSIIHGKGAGRGETYPVLKNKLNNLLRHRQEVLAFHSSPRHQGGVGAVNILLRRSQENDE